MHGVVLTLRADSSRVPNKWKYLFNNIPAIKIILDRISQAGIPTVVATSNRDVDKEIVSWCHKNSIEVYAGEFIDVRKRIYEASKLLNFDNIIEVLGDNLYIDKTLINKVVNAFESSKSENKWASVSCSDYSWISRNANIYPIGLRPIMYPRMLLEKYLSTQMSGHPTSCLYNDSNNIGILVSPEKELSNELKNLNLSLNYQINTNHFQRILKEEGTLVSFSKVIEIFEKKKYLRDFCAQQY
jgi:spore coat polysaccharide biosynthesis protein SpsF (cytidylyltransferase family)